MSYALWYKEKYFKNKHSNLICILYTNAVRGSFVYFIPVIYVVIIVDSFLKSVYFEREGFT